MATTSKMAIPYPASTDFVKNGATDMQAIADQVDAKTGLVFIKSQTIGTAVTSVNVTSCFSSSYDNYVVLFSNVAASVASDVWQVKLLSGTTAVTSGVYGNTYYVGNGAAGGLTNAQFSNTAHAEVGSKDTSSTNHGKFDVLGPFLAAYTRFNYFDTDDNYLRWHSSIHRANTSYDGFQFLPSTGTMTGGAIRVYGYNQ